MDDFRLHKRRILINLSVSVLISIIAIFFIIDAAITFKGQWTVILLLLLIIIQIPIFTNTTIIVTNLIATIEKEKKSDSILQEAELDNYEKEVEEKVRQADDLTFNINRFIEDLGQNNDWKTYGEKLLVSISKQVEILVGLVYEHKVDENIFTPVSSYAYYSENIPSDFKEGEGLLGQVVKDNKAMFLSDIPDGYIHMVSGLGEHKPNYLAFIPICKENKVLGVVEIASFKPFSESFERRISEISENFGNLAPNIEKNITNTENE